MLLPCRNECLRRHLRPPPAKIACSLRAQSGPKRPLFCLESAPGADPARIRMQFAGADALRLAANGDLLLEIGSEVLTQHAPVVYQTQASGRRVIVPAAYRIGANRDVTIALSPYDSTAPL